MADGVSGTFSGDAVGQGGEDNPVVVEITLEDSVITDVTASGPQETPGVGSVAIDTLPTVRQDAIGHVKRSSDQGQMNDA